jgi:hypothetical protein
MAKIDSHNLLTTADCARSQLPRRSRRLALVSAYGPESRVTRYQRCLRALLAGGTSTDGVWTETAGLASALVSTRCASASTFRVFARSTRLAAIRSRIRSLNCLAC